MVDSPYRCVLCGQLRIPLMRLGTGSICSCCEREVVESQPRHSGYLEQAHLIYACLNSQYQYWLQRS